MAAPLPTPTTSAGVAPAIRPGAVAVSIREILFPTDLSAQSERAFEHARLLAERFRARLTLYHAVEVPRSEYAEWMAGHEDAVWDRVEKKAHEKLTRQAEVLTVPHTVVVQPGLSAVPALVDVALLDLIRETQPDLTVMATHGRKGAARFFLGSVTEEVLRNSHRPVLCVRETEHGAGLPYRRILVPTDLSEASRKPFPMAALLAKTFEAEVIAVHVTPWPTLAALSGIPQALAAAVPSEASLWAFFHPDFADLEVTAQVHQGSAWERIVAAAREEKVDLILMSTRGHNNLGDRILGSQTERVVRHAPCPVLVY